MKVPGYIAVGPDGAVLRDSYGSVLLFRDRPDAGRCIDSDDAYRGFQPAPLVRWVRPRTPKPKAQEGAA